MLIHHKQLLLSLLIGTACAAAPKTLFHQILEEMYEIHSSVERHISQVQEEIKKSLAKNQSQIVESPLPIITENKATHCLEISLCPLAVKEKTFDASIDQDDKSMIITTPVGALHIQTSPTMVSVGFNYKVTQEYEQNGSKAHMITNNYHQNAKALSAELAMEETHIEYNQIDQKLTAFIPYRKKALLKIPVIIKDAEKLEK